MPTNTHRSFFSKILTSVIISIPILVFGALGVLYAYVRLNKPNVVQIAQKLGNGQVDSDVLGMGAYGSSRQSPQIYVSGGDYGYSSGGVISLASTDEPSVVIGGYNVDGNAEIKVYRANKDTLINYLVHDKDAKQINTKVDTKDLQEVTSFNKQINTETYEGSKVPLPLEDNGIWYLSVKLGGINTDAFVLRSDVGVLTKEADNELVFWGQSFKTKRSISEGKVKVVNLQENYRELSENEFDSEGMARARITSEADIALIESNGSLSLIPLNLKYINYGGYSYKEFVEKAKTTRYFTFTDRPLYKPGDKVYFKTVLRDDDDARYSIPSGKATVKIYYDWNQDNTVFEKDLPISSDGTISGEFVLPEDAVVGIYTLSTDIAGRKPNQYNWYDWDYSSTINFGVEYYRKPESWIEVSTNVTEYIAGDNGSFTITGSYFSGQPLLDQEIAYTIYASDFYEYQYLTDYENPVSNLSDAYRYGSWYGPHKVAEGNLNLDSQGTAKIEFDTKMDFNKGKSQIFSIEATTKGGTLDPSFSRKNVLVYAGEYGIYRKEYTYGTRVNETLEMQLALAPNMKLKKPGAVDLTAKVHLKKWIAYQEENQKYLSYRSEEKDFPNINFKTSGNSEGTLKFIPTETGHYDITVEGKDRRGNLVSKLFYAYVTDKDTIYYTGDSIPAGISLSLDKQEYLPTDTVKVEVVSEIADRDVFVSMERGRMDRFQIAKLNGKRATLEFPLKETDMPNMFVEALSFSESALDSGEVKVPVSPKSRRMAVGIVPDSTTYGPGDTVKIKVTTKDYEDKPVESELALWAVDKAIFELSDNRLGDIFDTFWSERYNSTQGAHSLEGISVQGAEGGGCFASGTGVLMGDGSTKNIEDVVVGDVVTSRKEGLSELVSARVTSTHKTEVPGYMIINDSLRVTSNHMLKVNDSWLEAGSVQIGDMLVDNEGNNVEVSSLEWHLGKFTVYNIDVETYHTYFANGVWVHNQKGSPRDTFNDTAYWNPSITTNSKGEATISFDLPDNLTTWTIAAVASDKKTMVGQTTTEIIVTKDVIVRPILPNIMRVGEEHTLSAIVQNFTDKDMGFDVSLEFDSGSVAGVEKKNVLIKSKGMQQLFWNVKPGKETEGTLTFTAIVGNDKELSDTVVKKVPIQIFGFVQKTAQNAEGTTAYDITKSEFVEPNKSSIALNMSPTITGVLPTAMKYLVGYPYGCVEQTTSKFVPAVIAQSNQQMFSELLEDVDEADIVQKGVNRLEELQQSDGGWSWWSHNSSKAYITAYVAEYLLQAKGNGANVKNTTIDRAKQYLRNNSYYDFKENRTISNSPEDLIAKAYGLAMLSEQSTSGILGTLNNVSVTPDILSLGVMANYMAGNTNPESNGLNRLISMAQQEGDSVYWTEGSKENFGSKDASTALAIRTLLMSGQNRDLAVKGARYLTRSRHTEYWSNTYATAQVVRALVELAKTGNEQTPNYSYEVTLDGNVLAQGTVNNPAQKIATIDVPYTDIGNGGSTLRITKSGDGQLYSSILVSEFITDKEAKPVNNGLSITKEMFVANDDNKQINVGDTVTVRLTVSGLGTDELYGVIHDELPSGLVPINEAMKNEQYGGSSDTYYDEYGVMDRDTTLNGMVLSLYKVGAGAHTYEYKARAINDGKFNVPPATVELMYAPEVNGRSAAQTMANGEYLMVAKGTGDGGYETMLGAVGSNWIKIVALGIGVLGVGAGTAFFFMKKIKRKKTPEPLEHQSLDE